MTYHSIYRDQFTTSRGMVAALIAVSGSRPIATEIARFRDHAAGGAETGNRAIRRIWKPGKSDFTGFAHDPIARASVVKWVNSTETW